MKKLLITALTLLISSNINAEMIRFRTLPISGKITSEQIDLTDWQAVMICHFNLSNKAQESMKYPLTQIKKINAEENVYSVQIKAMSLIEILPNLEITNCAYKLILIGKSAFNHQNLFGEVYLYGTEQRKMTEKELEIISNKEQISKLIESRLKDLVLIVGNDGGITPKNPENEQ